MSEYFRVLKRIEEEQLPRSPRPISLAAAARAKAPSPAARRERTLSAGPWGPTMAVTPSAAAVSATLLKSLRDLGDRAASRGIVFCGVSSTESVRSVISGLITQAQGLGLSTFNAELFERDGQTVLTRRSADEDELEEDSLALDLLDRDSTAATTWLGRTADTDLTLIEARPLLESADAGLLARACGGLVIVARTEVTRRESLLTAVERARATDCVIAGIVMQGNKRRVPHWLLELLPDDHGAPSAGGR